MLYPQPGKGPGRGSGRTAAAGAAHAVVVLVERVARVGAQHNHELLEAQPVARAGLARVRL